jgi:hypothetical protein
MFEIKEITCFKAGYLLSLVKTKILVDETSDSANLPIGTTITGILEKDIRERSPICMKIENGDFPDITKVCNIDFPTGKMIVTTEVAIYEAQR